MSLPNLPPPLPAPGPPRSLLWWKTGTIVSPTPERLQHQQGEGLKLAAVVLTLDSALRRKEEDCVPLPASWPGPDAGRESCFPSFEAAWVFVFLVDVSSGTRGLLELKAEWGQAGAARGRRPPRRRQRWWWGTWDVALMPWDCSHPSGEVQVGGGGCSLSPIPRAGSGTAPPASGWARTVFPTVTPARRAPTTAPRWSPSPTGQCHASGGGFTPKRVLQGGE